MALQNLLLPPIRAMLGDGAAADIVLSVAAAGANDQIVYTFTNNNATYNTGDTKVSFRFVETRQIVTVI